MILYTDADRTLEVDGLDGTRGPMLLICTCRHCGLELSRRRLLITDTDPDRLHRLATADAQEALDHGCLKAKSYQEGIRQFEAILAELRTRETTDGA